MAKTADWHDAGGGTAKTAQCRFCKVAREIEFDEDEGVEYCTYCGALVGERVHLVAEQSFSAGGHASFCDAGSLGDARARTFARARVGIERVVAGLHLSSDHVEAAHRMYALAHASGFTRGRRADVVHALVVYMAARMRASPVMLVDLADLLGLDVVALASSFLRLRAAVNVPVPVVDPSVFLHRFAARLGFGTRVAAVAESALRIVQRMQRDWMSAGRRPSGICGAALFVAARMHGLALSRAVVARVVAVGETTLAERLAEFVSTPASALTAEAIEAGEGMDLPACDPPAFKRARALDGSASASVSATATATASASAPLSAIAEPSAEPSAEVGPRVALKITVPPRRAPREASVHGAGAAGDPELDDGESPICSAEIDALLCSPRESAFKLAVWNHLHERAAPPPPPRQQHQRAAQQKPQRNAKRKRPRSPSATAPSVAASVAGAARARALSVARATEASALMDGLFADGQ